jgi:predicted PurR-regulated permease PerM
MKTIRDFLADTKTKRWALYVILTTFLLYLTYIIAKNMGVVLAATGAGIGAFISALSPVWIGLLFAYLFNPFIEFLERTLASRIVRINRNSSPANVEKRLHRRKLVAVLIAYIIILLILVILLYGFVALILGQFVITSVPKLLDNLTNILTSYEHTIRSWATNMPSGLLSNKASGFVDNLFGWVANSVDTESIINTLKNIGGTVINLAIGLIISIYLSYDKELFIGGWNALLRRICTPARKLSVNNTLNEVNTVLSTFLRGVMLDALIVAILSSVGLTVIGLQFSVFVGLFAGICNVIPYFGPILGMIPAFIVGMLTQSVGHGLLAVVVLLVIQQIDGNLIYPKIVGGNTGLHPLLVLVSVFVAGHFWGLIGMVCAVPAVGIIKLFVYKWLSWMDKKHEAEEAFSNLPHDDAEDIEDADETQPDE